MFDEHVEIKGVVYTKMMPNRTRLWKVCSDLETAKKHTALYDDVHASKTEWIYETRVVHGAA